MVPLYELHLSAATAAVEEATASKATGMVASSADVTMRYELAVVQQQVWPS